MKVKVSKELQGYAHAFGTSKNIENNLRLNIYKLEDDSIYTIYHGNKNHGGYPGVLHGGLVTAILDEISGWTIIDASGGYYCVTAQFNTSFIRPVELSKTTYGLAKIINKEGRKHFVHAYLYDEDLNVLAKGEGLFIEKSFVGQFSNPQDIRFEPLAEEKLLYVDIPQDLF